MKFRIAKRFSRLSALVVRYIEETGARLESAPNHPHLIPTLTKIGIICFQEKFELPSMMNVPRR